MPLSRNASARAVFFCIALALEYKCARLLLHLAHAGTRFSNSLPPPRSSSMMWSAWVAGARLHQWHTGLPCNTTRLFFR